jgi:hypothetical protein
LTLVNATEKVKEYAIYYYGNLFSAEEPVFDEKERLWTAELKSNYPRLIKNDKPEERFIRVLPLRRLGTICLNENLQFAKHCSSKREESISLINTYLEMWREQVENIIVTTSSLQLAKTHPARTFLHPANMILSFFRRKKSSILTFEQLEKLRRPARKERWLALLEDLKLIEKNENGYVYGDRFPQLERYAGNDREFEIVSMAYILETSYPILKEIFHIRQFEPLVHLDSCYYRPALEAEEVLHQTSDSLFKRFVAEYMYRPNIELAHTLSELRNSEALRCRDAYYYANEELFEKMLNLKSQVPIMALPRA